MRTSAKEHQQNLCRDTNVRRLLIVSCTRGRKEETDRDEIVIFVHDDVTIGDLFLQEKMTAAFDQKNYAIAGLAGTSKSALTWDDILVAAARRSLVRRGGTSYFGRLDDNDRLRPETRRRGQSPFHRRRSAPPGGRLRPTRCVPGSPVIPGLGRRPRARNP